MCEKRNYYWNFIKDLMIDYDNGYDMPLFVDKIPTLAITACSGNIDWVKFLLNLGFKVDEVQVETNRNAFFSAVRVSDVKMIRFLLENGANPNHKDIKGDCVFGYLIGIHPKFEEKLQCEILELILDYGFDIKQNFRGSPLLQTAIYYGKLDIAKILIKRGSNLWGVATLAYKYGFDSLVEIIQKKQIEELSKKTALQIAISIPLETQIQLLVIP